jgi:hypothetical protein
VGAVERKVPCQNADETVEGVPTVTNDDTTVSEQQVEATSSEQGMF